MMFIAVSPPVDRPSLRPVRVPSAIRRRVSRIFSLAFAGISVLAAFGLVNSPRTSVADALKNELAIETIELSQFPIPGSIYESTGGTSFPPLEVDLSFMSWWGKCHETVGCLPLPGPGGTAVGEAVFDVGVEVVTSTEHDNLFDFGRPASVRITEGPPVAEAAGAGDPIPSGTWHTELLSLEIMGQVTGPSGPMSMILRESPTRPSLGQHVLTPLPDGFLHINSFFDVFFELSLNGGPYAPASGAVRLDITDIVPEPASLLSTGIGLAGVGMFLRRPRRRGEAP
jgi:hypothetical protein